VTGASRYRLTASPAGLALSNALTRALEGEGASPDGEWKLLGSGGTAMVLIVTAPDAAAVHRAIANVRLAGKVEIHVTHVAHLTR
jgi:uncharacterized protein with GYD domain